MTVAIVGVGFYEANFGDLSKLPSRRDGMDITGGQTPAPSPGAPRHCTVDCRGSLATHRPPFYGADTITKIWDF